MRRHLVAAALATIMLAGSAGLAPRASADTGKRFFHKTWEAKPTWWHNRDAFGWELGMTAEEVKDLLEVMQDVNDAGGLVKDVLSLIQVSFPALNAWKVVTAANVFMLKQCSDHGKNGVVIYGFHETKQTAYPEMDSQGRFTGKLRWVTVEGDAVYWCSPQE